MIGGFFSQRAARNAQYRHEEAARRLAAHHREQAEHHNDTLRRSHLGPRKYKCGPWRWVIAPVPGTVMHHVFRLRRVSNDKQPR